jgi:hypothetical protein
MQITIAQEVTLMAEENCENLNCMCELSAGSVTTKDGKNYCSEFCASSEGANTEDCGCGHEDCE